MSEQGNGPYAPPPSPQGRGGNGEWERRTIEKLLLQVYKERKYQRIVRWLFVLFLIFILVMVSNMGSKKTGSSSAPHTAVIKLNGPIMEQNETDDRFLEALKSAYKNPNVKGIIIAANSPGGSAVLSDNIFTEMKLLRKKHPKIPVYAVAKDMCASGCYYIISAADKIYANQASLIGSIGVIYSNFGFDKLISKYGIERRLKTAGKYKGMGDPFTPESPEVDKIWHESLNQIHARFIEQVKVGRGDRLKFNEYPDVFSGRIYTGEEGVKVGLADEFGNIYTVSRDVIKAPKMLDYTVTENLATRFAKSVGSKFSSMFGLEEDEGIQLR